MIGRTGSVPGSAAKALGPPSPGRPVSKIGKYLLNPSTEVNSGFEMINTDPNVLKTVHQKYISAFMLPPSLQPKYLRKPEVMDAERRRSISRGWRKPGSHQG